MTRKDIYKSVNGSLETFSVMDEELFNKYKLDDLGYAEFCAFLNENGLNKDNIVCLPGRLISNVFYIEPDKGIYVELVLSKHIFQEMNLISQLKSMMMNGNPYLLKKHYIAYYAVTVPVQFKIFDFQEMARYKEIPIKDLLDVFIEVHTTTDYSYGLWKKEMIDYVFSHMVNADTAKLLGGTLKTKVKVYRGMGRESTQIPNAFAWTTNFSVAVRFACFAEENPEIYTGHVYLKDIVKVVDDRNEDEIIVSPNNVYEAEKLCLDYYNDRQLVEKLDVISARCLFYGSYLNYYYEKWCSDAAYHSLIHDKQHSYRVLVNIIFILTSYDVKLTPEERVLITNFCILHDLGRINDEVDTGHGVRAVKLIKQYGYPLPYIEEERILLLKTILQPNLYKYKEQVLQMLDVVAAIRDDEEKACLFESISANMKDKDYIPDFADEKQVEFIQMCGQVLDEEGRYELLEDLHRISTCDMAWFKLGLEYPEQMEALFEELELPLTEDYKEILNLFIQYHCMDDIVGFIKIDELANKTLAEKERLKYLFSLCKDADALDRLRTHELDYEFLRTEEARKMPLISYKFIDLMK